ncbi:hypothetical protein PsYK624_068650 [Phanerochaete sordida]|uniref:Uncharacterized protein n=1 Tax=Phanerochaete sordida TaxID=48140 RepID=A0A9P3G9K6_9APHY|nr:hypothetical protein PsYK624_068650 [Phanerochaete sordida]
MLFAPAPDPHWAAAEGALHGPRARLPRCSARAQDTRGAADGQGAAAAKPTPPHASDPLEMRRPRPLLSRTLCDGPIRSSR